MKEKIWADIDAGMEDATPIKRIEADRWVLASILQKAIRRGDSEVGLRAGKSLWHVDKASFWRRVHTAAVEDIGIADLDTLTKCLSGYWATSWRKHKDLEVGLSLIRSMCASVKCRVADELYLLIERDTNYERLRKKLAELSDSELQAVVTGKEPLTTRALALWYLAGTDRFPSEFLKKRSGSKDAVAEIIQDMTIPLCLNEACLAILYRTQWPLALFTPLICQKTEGIGKAAAVETSDMASVGEVEGIPLWGVDQYSRVGKACIRSLMGKVPALKRFTTAQVGMGVFYLEGAATDKSLTSAFLDDIRQGSELAMMSSLNIGVPEYLGMREILKQEFEAFNDIRRDQISRYAADFRGGLI